MDTETIGFFAILTGLVICAIAFIWLVVAAFRVHVGWGVALLIFPPAALLFMIMQAAHAARPALLLSLGVVVIAAPYGVNYYHRAFVDLGPREKRVDGEIHITLTGWDSADYAILESKNETVVLQMANADVTDQTLAHLKGMSRLRELDLNGSQISDAGLQLLAELPALEELRLARMKISDAGFVTHFGNKASLRSLDLTGTEVKGKTKRAWKAAVAGRRLVD